MINYYTIFVTIDQAAELIISAAKQTGGKGLDAFHFDQNNDAPDAQTTPFSQKISLCFTHNTSRGPDLKVRTKIKSVFQDWVNGHGVSATSKEGTPPEADYPWTVEDFWLHVLFNIGPPASNTKVDGQLLALMPIEGDDQQAAVVAHLAANATYTRTAITEHPPGRRLGLFHIKDDHARDSSFQSVIDAGYFPALELLEEYTDGESSIFLHARLNKNDRLIQPGQTGLSLFCKFLRAAPFMWNGETASNASSSMLAAVLPQDMENQDASQGFRVLDLRSLNFINQSQLVFRADAFCKVEVISLKDSYSASGEDLRKAIQQAEPFIGYSLYLRDTGLHLHYGESIDIARCDQEISTLVDEINNRQYRLALLQSVSVRKPLLLRFTHKQLPALADYLRTLSPKRLAEGVLQYAFQATGTFPQGYHYLFLSPEILAEADITPLYSWPNLEEKRVFWLDPFWARYYPDSIDRCYVFVPYQQALFPSMHNWDEQDMDEYLREVMKEWASQEQGEVNIPDTPLYVFDPFSEYNSGDELIQEMRVFVLDLKDFQNIKVNLPWINDNLVLHEELSTGETIQALADAKTKIAMVNAQLEKEKEKVQLFRESANRVKEQLDTLITNLADSISSQLNRINLAGIDASDKARSMNDRLRTIEQEYQTLTAMLEQMNTTAGSVKKDAEGKLSEAQSAFQKVSEALKETTRAQSHMEESTTNAILRLETEEQRQRQRLANIRIGRSS